MADKAWKRVEREKCRALGGQRTGPRGFGLPDCTGIKVALEVKHYKRFTFLTKDWEQAVENAERVGLMPVLAVKEAGRNGRDCVQLCIEGELIRVPWKKFVVWYHEHYNKEEIIG